jgi:hypothetical protein
VTVLDPKLSRSMPYERKIASTGTDSRTAPPIALHSGCLSKMRTSKPRARKASPVEMEPGPPPMIMTRFPGRHCWEDMVFLAR